MLKLIQFLVVKLFLVAIRYVNFISTEFRRVGSPQAKKKAEFRRVGHPQKKQSGSNTNLLSYLVLRMSSPSLLPYRIVLLSK